MLVFLLVISTVTLGICFYLGTRLLSPMELTGGALRVGWAAIFLLGLLQQSYWALALPVAIVVAFVLGLTFWVGYTIATIQVEPYEEADPEDPQPPGDEHPA